MGRYVEDIAYVVDVGRSDGWKYNIRVGPMKKKQWFEVVRHSADNFASVTLGEPVAEAENRIGTPQSVPVVNRTNLRHPRYSDLGVDLLASELVLAICLHGDRSPAIPIRYTSFGAAVEELRVGLTKDQLDAILQLEDYDYRQLDGPEVSYHFYRNLGLAVRVHNGRVEELVVAQIPERSMTASF